jgi:nucleoside 2-deoxyribosyltransferase
VKTVYLCGGINGLSDAEANGWRVEATARLSAAFDVLDPMARDYRGKEAENVRAIVDGDLADIAAADVILVRADRPSWGTAMEVYHAFAAGKTVVAFGAGPRPSPWLAAHATFLAADLTAALCWIEAN